MKSLVIGSRGSKLALTQTGMVRDWIQKQHPELEIRIQVIKTSGDRVSELSLPQAAGESKGLFVKEIEEALLAGTIDLAVHSLKDLPASLPEGLRIGAFPRREDPRDTFITRQKLHSLEELPRGAVIATGSPRRSVQLQRLRPDIKIVNIRGNVDTRIRKMEKQGLDGIILAAAGLKRMGLETRISFTLSLEQMIPAVGQGALALEIREKDHRTSDLLRPLECPLTRLCVEAERHFLNRMGGGCQVPMGAHASLEGKPGSFRAFVADVDRRQMLRNTWSCTPDKLLSIAEQAAQSFLENGALECLTSKGKRSPA